MCQELYINALARRIGYVGQMSYEQSWERIDPDPFRQFGPPSFTLSLGESNSEFAEHRPQDLIAIGAVAFGAGCVCGASSELAAGTGIGWMLALVDDAGQIVWQAGRRVQHACSG